MPLGYKSFPEKMLTKTELSVIWFDHVVLTLYQLYTKRLLEIGFQGWLPDRIGIIHQDPWLKFEPARDAYLNWGSPDEPGPWPFSPLAVLLLYMCSTFGRGVNDICALIYPPTARFVWIVGVYVCVCVRGWMDGWMARCVVGWIDGSMHAWWIPWTIP